MTGTPQGGDAAEIELRLGGLFRTAQGGQTFDGEVVEIDPPRLLAVLWGGDLLRLELADAPGGTSLVLLHVLRSEGADAAARTAAGSHACLGALARACLDAGMPSGAPVPGPD